MGELSGGMGDLFDGAIGVLQQPEAVTTLRERTGATESAAVSHAARLAVPVAVGHLRRWIDDEATSARLIQILGSIDRAQIAEPGLALAAGADQAAGSRLTRPLVADRALVARIGAAIGDETGIGAAAATGLLVPAAWAVAGVLVRSVDRIERDGLSAILAAEETDLLARGRRRWLDPRLLPERTLTVPDRPTPTPISTPSSTTAATPSAVSASTDPPAPVPAPLSSSAPSAPTTPPATVTELRPVGSVVEADDLGPTTAEPPVPARAQRPAPPVAQAPPERLPGRPDAWQLAQAETLPPLSQSTVTAAVPAGGRPAFSPPVVASASDSGSVAVPAPVPVDPRSPTVGQRPPRPASRFPSPPPPPAPGPRGTAEYPAGRPDPGLVGRRSSTPRRRGWPRWLLALLVVIALAIALAVAWLIDPTLFGLR